MAWYLPLALLTIFRPNLEDRVALSVLGEGWRSPPAPLAGRRSGGLSRAGRHSRSACRGGPILPAGAECPPAARTPLWPGDEL